MSFSNSADAQSSSLGANLASNNPFRNRAVSPLNQHPRGEAPPRPVSRNPFLDDAVFDNNGMNTKENARPEQKFRVPSPPTARGNPLIGNAATLFDELTLEDNSRQPRPSPPNRSMTDHNNRKENVVPRGPLIHRPSRSQEQTNGMRRGPPPSGSNGISRQRREEELDIFADGGPQIKSPERRNRRNSDSSVMDRKSIDEEKRRQERRRRERKEREAQDLKDGKPPKKPSRKLDIIDQLDATSIYGTGLFHHDGPFDACNPHRNKKGRRNAPMQAFPKDSLNNSLRGGPNNAKADHSTFLGQSNVDAYKDFSKGGNANGTYEGYGPQKHIPAKSLANVQSATAKVEPVHGDESMGLGTSTFLDGAPASRAAVAKAAQEEAENRERMQPGTSSGGLGRKKSIAQKIRGISNNRRDFSNGPQYRSAEPRYSPTTPKFTPNGTATGREHNPFFNEFGEAVNGNGVKQDQININENRVTQHQRAPSSPGPALERRVTTDSIGFADGGYGNGQPLPQKEKSSGGFLNRVKSLKGGRRPKAEKPVYE